MRLASVKDALVRTYADVDQNHTMQMAAALAYYFVLSFFPALIFLSAVVAYLPVPDLFNQALALMARFLPADTMGLVRRVLGDVVTPNRGTFLSFGILGTLWAASGGFAAIIEALNTAYQVKDDRPFWNFSHALRPACWLRSTQVSSTKASGIEKNVDRASCAWTRYRPPAAE